MTIIAKPPVSKEEDSGVWRFASSRGDAVEPSWPELVRAVRAQVRSLVGPSRDLEDLTQATLEQLVRSLPRFEGRSELTTFTYRIACHVVMNHWRSLRRFLRCFVLGHDEVPEPVAENDDRWSFLERQRAARLHHHLDRLSPDHRLAVVLADLEELPASQIAEIVGCPEATIRSRLKRGRAELAKRLARDPLFAEHLRPSPQDRGEP